MEPTTVQGGGTQIDELAVARIATTLLEADAGAGDPLTGDALPRPLGALLRSVHRAVQQGRRPLPFDGLQQLVGFVARPLEALLDSPRQRIDRSHAMMPLHAVRELDVKCAGWLGRQPGRTVREKLASRQSLLGVRREFSEETNENILVAKFMRGLLPLIDQRLAAVERGDYDAVDPARLEALEHCQRLCSRALRHSVFGSIDHRKPVRANNVLLGDRRYQKLWRGWRWLRALETGEDKRRACAADLFRQAVLVSIAAEISQRCGGVHGEQLVRMPSWSMNDVDRWSIDGLRHTGDHFEWSAGCDIEFVVKAAGKHPKHFIRLGLRRDGIQINTRRGIDCLVDPTERLFLRGDGPGEDRSISIQLVASTTGGDGEDLRVRVRSESGETEDVCADLEGVRRIVQRAVDPMLGAIALRPRTAHVDTSKPRFCGIDLGFSKPVVSIDSTPRPCDVAGISVGFEVASGMDSEPREMEWLAVDDSTSIDIFRKGVQVTSIRGLIDVGEEQAPWRRAGVSLILQAFGEELAKSMSVLPGTPKAVAVPDSYDELSQSELRSLFNSHLGSTVPLWRTSCLLMGWQAKGDFVRSGVREGDAIMVLDGCSDGLSLAVFTAHHDDGLAKREPASRGIHWTRRPAICADDMDPRLAQNMRTVTWKSLLLRYTRRIVERDLLPEPWSDETHESLCERIVEAGYSDRILRRQESVVIPLGSAGSGFLMELRYDEKLFEAAEAEFRTDLESTIQQLLSHQLVRAYRQSLAVSEKRWHVLLGDVPSLLSPKEASWGTVRGGRSLLDHRFWACGAGQVVALGATGDIAANGAAVLLRRSEAEVPSVANWLPPLSLELIDSGGFREFMLMDEGATAPSVMGHKLSVPVEEVLQIPQGANEVRFPLFEGRAMRQDREVCLTSPAFPLKAPTNVRLTVEYVFGDEQPYRLLVSPIDFGGTVQIAATIGVARSRENPVPSFPAPRPWTDPTVIEEVEKAWRKSDYWWQRLEHLARNAASVDIRAYNEMYHPVMKQIDAAVRFIWADGRTVSDATPEIRKFEEEMPFERLWKYAACDERFAKLLNERLTDDAVRKKLRRWARKILARRHSESEARLLPAVLAEAEGEPDGANIELLGLLAGDGKGNRAECVRIISEGVIRSFRALQSNRVRPGSILALSTALWRDRELVHELHQTDPEIVAAFFANATDMIEHCRKEAAKCPESAINGLFPQGIRAVGEAAIAFLRLRSLTPMPPAIIAGSATLIRLGIAFCDAERELNGISNGDPERPRTLLLRSQLRFEIQRAHDLNATSDLAFALRHYLNGGSEAMIRIVGVTED
jgi:hypothetical protein